MSEKKKIRFTAVDAVVVVVLIAVIGFIGFKFLGTESDAVDTEAKTFTVSYYFEEVPEFAAKLIKKGDPVTDEAAKHELGTVTKVTTDEAAIYCTDSSGKLNKSSKEGYRSVQLTTEVEGLKTKHGIEVEDTDYIVGHALVIYAGGAKLYGKISEISAK